MIAKLTKSKTARGAATGRQFAGGIARALFSNRIVEPKQLFRDLELRQEQCLKLLLEAGMKLPPTGGNFRSDRISAADVALRFADSLLDDHENTFYLEVIGAAELLAAMAVLFDALTDWDDGNAPKSRTRIIAAALLVGRYETLHVTTQVGLFNKAGLAEVRQRAAKGYGADSGKERQRQAAKWQKRARDDFASAQSKNSHLTPEVWARRNAARYDKKPQTVAKAIKARPKK